MQKVTPVILSGGSGSRLWPLSRSKYPKQFTPILGHKSFFVQAAERVSPTYGFERPMVIAGDDHRFIVNRQAEEAEIELGDFLLEPIGRNTAPAIIIAAH